MSCGPHVFAYAWEVQDYWVVTWIDNVLGSNSENVNPCERWYQLTWSIYGPWLPYMQWLLLVTWQSQNSKPKTLFQLLTSLSKTTSRNHQVVSFQYPELHIISDSPAKYFSDSQLINPNFTRWGFLLKISWWCSKSVQLYSVFQPNDTTFVSVRRELWAQLLES